LVIAGLEGRTVFDATTAEAALETSHRLRRAERG
jgi:hypothetical protein